MPSFNASNPNALAMHFSRRRAKTKHSARPSSANQDRLRENLKSAPQGSDLARLYAQKMLTQENALDKLDSDIKDVRERYEQARKLLGDKVRTLKS